MSRQTPVVKNVPLKRARDGSTQAFAPLAQGKALLGHRSAISGHSQ
jgi:hypothetical protein